MLTPDYLLHVSEGAEEIAAQLHTDIIKRISRRVMARMQRGDGYTLTSIDKWQIETLLDAGYLRDDIAKDIADATGKEAEEIRAAFEDAGVRTFDYDDRVYNAAGISTTKLQDSPAMIRLMQRNYDATMGEWSNYTRTTADASVQAFINTMDRAYNNVMSGNIGYIQAFTEAINTLAKEGIQKIAYPSGHVDTIETATLRAVRTGVSQASAQIQIARMDENDIDLVLVSSHLGARPSHQVWQGKVYSRSGKSKKYADFYEATGYGTGAGLCGWNCRHNFSPWIPGMDNPFERYDSEENKKAYDESQKQRAMERGIRSTRREADVKKDQLANAASDEERQTLSDELAYMQKQLKRETKAYQDYCDAHGLRPLPERLKIAKTGRAKVKNS